MPNEPQLSCLGISPDGNMIGCAANWMPDYEAVARSLDGAQTWSKVWRFVELAGPLQCPAGTAEYDICDQQQWSSQQQQSRIDRADLRRQRHGSTRRAIRRR